jgi:hypothetical protein
VERLLVVVYVQSALPAALMQLLLLEMELIAGRFLAMYLYICAAKMQQ